ncbi:MAG: polyphosphate kinase 2 family protein, partial [Vicinamibacterales bacterium]
YVIPADNKWFTRLAVAQVIIEALESLDLHLPPLDPDKKRELAEARRRLRANPPSSRARRQS